MSKFNPSVLLISAFLYSVFISFNNFEFIYCFPIIFMFYCEYNSIWTILKKLLFLNLFIMMIFIVLLIQNDFQEALNIYIRTNMIILFNLLLFSNSSGYDIVRALNELKFPNRFVSLVYFTLKMIQVLKDEFKKIKQTLKSRGFKPSSSLFTYETYGNLFGHIFVKSIKKASAMEESFQLRGFHGQIYLINNSKLSLNDLILISLVCMLFVRYFVL